MLYYDCPDEFSDINMILMIITGDSLKICKGIRNILLTQNIDIIKLFVRVSGVFGS